MSARKKKTPKRANAGTTNSNTTSTTNVSTDTKTNSGTGTGSTHGSDAARSAGPPPLTRRRFWRTRRILFVLVLLALVVRIALPTVITSVATSWAKGQGLDLEIEELDLALVSGGVHLWGLTVSKDGERALAIESIDLDIEMSALFDGNLVVRRFEVDGVDARLERAEDGRLTLLDGFATSDAPEEVQDEPAVERVPLESLELPVTILAARVQRVHVEWTDRAVVPPVDMVMDLDLSISDLGVSGETARARLRLEAPGAVDRIALDATLENAREFLRADVSLDFTGLDGDGVTAYLEAAGIEAPDRGQNLRLDATTDLALVGPDQLEGSVELVQSLGSAVGAGTSSWLELARVTANFVPDDRGTHIDVSATGLRLAADRATDGRLVVAGFTLGSDPAAPQEVAAADSPADDASKEQGGNGASASTTPEANANAGPPSSPSPIRLASAELIDARVALTDRAVGATTPEAEAVQLVLEIANVRLDFNVPGGDVPNGAMVLSATLAAPDVFGTAQINGRFAADGGGARVSIDAITLERLRPYLAAADMEPTGASCGLELAIEFGTEGGTSTTRITEVALVDGPRTPFTAARIEFTETNGVIDAVIEGLVLRASSEAAGRTTFGPLRLGRMPAASAATDGGIAATDSDAEATSTGATEAPAAESGLRPEPIVVELDARIAGLDMGGGGGTGTLTIEARAPGLVERVSLTGEIAGLDGALRVDATLAVEGLRERALGAQRPNPDERARELRAELALRMQPDVAGGERLEVRIDALDLDGQLTAESIVLEGRLGGPAGPDGGEPVLIGTLRASGLAAPEFELEAGTLGLDVMVAKVDGADRTQVTELVVEDGRTSLRIADVEFVAFSDENGTHIGTAHVEGVEIDAIRRADGALEVAGLTVVPPTRTPAAITGTGVSVAIPPDVSVPVTTEPAATRTARRNAPRLSIGSLVVDIARLEILDEANGTTTRARVHLENVEPCVLFDPQGEEEPLELTLEAALEPGIGSLAIELVATPDESGLALALGLRAEGLDAAGWVQAWPPLAETIAPEGVVDGRLALDLTARIDAPRTDATGFDLRRMSNAVVEVRDLSFLPTTADDGPKLAIALARTQIRSLGSPTAPLRLGEVEVLGAALDVEQRADGLAIAGLVLRTTEPVEPPKDVAKKPAPAGQATGNGAPAAAGAPKTAPPAGTGGGVTIDHIQWTGLDLVYTDLTATPVVRLPIEDFEVDVRQLAIGTPARRPLQFRAALRGGVVDLPEPRTEGSFLGNLTREITGTAKEQRSERRWVDELLVSGSMSPGSAPEGWIRAELFSFELMAIEGLAAGGGVEIGAGTVDTNIRVDLRGSKGQRVKSRTTFTSLSVNEPADGPISRFLRLPAPLDTVLWILRNERGEQVIPLSFTIDESGLSTAELVSQGTQALVRLITDALASSPLRLGGGLLDFVGLDPFGSPKDAPDVGPPIELAFEVGDTRLTAAAQAQVTEILRALGKDDGLIYRVGHRYIPGDIERARALAIPDVDESRALARRLEVERDQTVLQLAFERERLARLVATGAREEAETLTAELRTAAARLDGVERSLDTLYELSVPADERTQQKRVAAAALRLAERRFEALVRELFARGAGDDLARLQFARPRLEDVVDGTVDGTADGDAVRATLVFTPRVR